MCSPASRGLKNTRKARFRAKSTFWTTNCLIWQPDSQELVQPQVADDATNGRRIFGIFLFNRSALEAPVKSTRWGRQPPPAPIPWASRPRPPVRTQRTRIERTKAHIFTRRQHADPTVRGQHAQRSHGQHCMRRASAACVPAADSSAHAPSARPSTSPFPLAVPRLRRQ